MTDEEYYKAVVKLAGKRPVRQIVIDPSAASFIQCIKSHGRFSVRKAKNGVVAGIQHVAQMLNEGRIFFSEECADTIREFSLYVWEQNGAKDQPVKENDHAMDDVRYLVETVVFGGNGLSF